MSNVVNLNQFRKIKAREDHRRKGDENAAKFGRSKSEKAAQKAQKDKSKRDLDGHELDL